MEPFSIVVSAFGLTTGVINILLSTITAIEQRRRELREYNERLRVYKRRLDLVQISIEAWKAVWGGFSDTTYRYFWTEEGFDEMDQWLRDLKKLTLDFESELEESPRPKWSLRQLLGQSEETNETRISPRIAFALYKNNKLRDMIDSLELQVRQLDEFTAKHYQKQQKGKRPERPTHAELNRSENLRVFMERFSQFAECLHEFQKTLKNTREWALELRFPDNKGSMIQWDRMEEIDLDFSLHVQGNGSVWSSKRIRIRYMSTTDPATIFNQIIAAIGEGFHEKDFVSLLNPSRRRSLPYNEIFSRGLLVDDDIYKAWDEDRANLTFGFVNWVILFWNTPLLAQPCCCGLRFHDLNGSERQHIFTISEQYHFCYDSIPTQRKLLMLGSVLIELTLAMHVKIKLEKGGDGISYDLMQKSRTKYVFYLKESGNNSWNRVTLPFILQKISQKCYNSVQITNAIGYCFENASDDISGFNPFFIAHYVEEILKP